MKGTVKDERKRGVPFRVLMKNIGKRGKRISWRMKTEEAEQDAERRRKEKRMDWKLKMVRQR